MITVGIVLATISAPRRPSRTTTASAQTVATASPSTDMLSENVQYVAGIALLSLALFMSAWLGIWQEQTYKMYGKQWREALFYCVRLCGGCSTTWRLTRTKPAFPLSTFLYPPLPIPTRHIPLIRCLGASSDHIDPPTVPQPVPPLRPVPGIHQTRPPLGPRRTRHQRHHSRSVHPGRQPSHIGESSSREDRS
jgi:hypothetical protein